MSDLGDLYQQVIIDHSRRPRNFRIIEGPKSQKAEGYNPLCGDRLTLYLTLDGNRVIDASFQGSGCAISTASASMLTEHLKGKTVEETDAIFRQFHALVTGETVNTDALGKLSIFEGVREFPTRVKCATLAWHTLKAALEHQNQPASTE